MQFPVRTKRANSSLRGTQPLCHKPILRRAKYLHQKQAQQATYALILCITAMYLNGAEDLVFARQLITACLQRIGISGILLISRKI